MITLRRTISVVMANSGDPPQLACGESSESAMGVRSVELSASLKVFLSVCLKPLVTLPLLRLKNFSALHAADAGAHHDTLTLTVALQAGR